MAETEKITVNLNVVDLGKVDILVDEGFYTNRADFLRTAIRSELDRHRDHLDKITSKKNFYVGMMHLSIDDFEEYFRNDITLDIRGVGILRIDPDVTIEMVERTVSSIKIWGKLVMPKDVRERLEQLGRIH